MTIYANGITNTFATVTPASIYDLNADSELNQLNWTFVPATAKNITKLITEIVTEAGQAKLKKHGSKLLSHPNWLSLHLKRYLFVRPITVRDHSFAIQKRVTKTTKVLAVINLKAVHERHYMTIKAKSQARKQALNWLPRELELYRLATDRGMYNIRLYNDITKITNHDSFDNFYGVIATTPEAAVAKATKTWTPEWHKLTPQYIRLHHQTNY